MNEEIAKALGKILQYVEGVEAFTLEQSPLVAQEIVTAHVLNAIGLMFTIPLFALLCKAMAHVWSKEAKESVLKTPGGDISDVVLFKGMGTTCVGIGLCLSAYMICSDVCSLLEVWLTPRLVILEKLASMAG